MKIRLGQTKFILEDETDARFRVFEGGIPQLLETRLESSLSPWDGEPLWFLGTGSFLGCVYLMNSV